MAKNIDVSTKSIESWDDFRLLLAFKETGSKGAVAEIMGFNRKTIQAKLDRLEDKFGKLVGDNNVLTELGEKWAQKAEHMRDVLYFQRSNENKATDIHFVALDGVGSLILGSRLYSLARLNPDTSIYFGMSDEAPDFGDRGADLYLGTDLPKDDRVTTTHIGYTRASWFATQSYFKKYGKPASKFELHNHYCTVPLNRRFPDPYGMLRLVYGDIEAPKILLKLHNMDLYYRSVLNGDALVLLPDYAVLVFPEIEMALRFPHVFRLYLSVKKSVANRADIKKLVKYITSIFDETRYPWFGEVALDPVEIKRMAEKMGYRVGKS